MSFGINASARVQLPAGRYRLQVYVDDGARIWLDDQLIIDAYRQARQHSSAYSVDVEFTDDPREMRVQYFQHGEAAILWITAEPMPAVAD